MKVPVEFDGIRPFEPEELPQVFERLLADGQFRQVLAFAMPGVPFGKVREKMLSCKTNLEFQLSFCYGFVQFLVDKLTSGCDMDASAVDVEGRYTFVSNHRDIVLDSGFLDKLLIDAGFKTTCEIAIGDNLLSLPWVKDLVRVNKSFIVQRALSMRQMLESSARMSRYIHFAVTQKQENVWIAQREGRAKDSDDRTQPSILKMLNMSGKGDVVSNLMELNIFPVAISYEFDPCDYLKAKEFQQKRDDPNFVKSQRDDLLSMETGILNNKGRVHFSLASPINDQLAQLDRTLDKNELINRIAGIIDKEIYKHYRFYPCNYVAYDMLTNTRRFGDHYGLSDKKQFEAYLQGQLDKIVLPNKDEAFLRTKILEMYTNPLKNHLAIDN